MFSELRMKNKEKRCYPSGQCSGLGNQRSDWTAVIWILLGVAVIYGAYIAINRKKQSKAAGESYESIRPVSIIMIEAGYRILSIKYTFLRRNS